MQMLKGCEYRPDKNCKSGLPRAAARRL